MSLRAAGLIVVAGLLAGACVSSYDPSGPPRLGLGERGPGMQRPRTIEPGPVLVTASEPAQVPTGTPQWSPTLPASAAGEQMAWLMTALNGTANLKRVDRRLSPEFMQQATPEQVRSAIRHWRRDELNNAAVQVHRAIEEEPGKLVAILKPVGARAEDARFTQVRLSVDNRGRVAGLRLAPAIDVEAVEINTWERLDARLSALPGRISLAAMDVGAGTSVHGLNAETHLGIGSASRLFILGALAEMIAGGEATWDQLLAIRDDLKSLPPGRMQLEDEGDEFPLSRFAELMMTIGDNTASDHLLAFLGRDRVEQFMARVSSADERSTPFLSTMESLTLRMGIDPALAERFASADEEKQREMLAPGGDVDSMAPAAESATGVPPAPVELDRIGWFASTSELTRLVARAQALESRPEMEPLRRMLRVRTGLAFDGVVWPSVAFVGGAEPGVINLTWLLTRSDGRMFALSATWNNAEGHIDQRQLGELIGAAVRLLAQEGKPR